MATVTSTLKMIDSMTPVLKSVTNSINLTLSAMQSMQKSMDKTFDTRAIDAARKSVQQAEAAIRKMSSEIENAKNAQENLNKSINRGKNNIQDFARNVLSAVGAFYLFDKVRELFSDLVRQGINFHAFMQSANVAMTTMLGNAEEAKQYLDELYAFAKTTPFAFPDLVTAGRNLIAFGMDARNTIPVLKAIGDAAAAVGGGTREMMAIADVFGAIQVAGKLSLQEVNRLHTHGIPALKILANQANMSADEMRKAISKGAIDANTAIAALVKGIEEGTDGIAGQTAKMGGMMAELKNTWWGAIDSLKAAWRNAGAEITEQHMEKLISGIHSLTELVRQIPNIIGPVVDFLVAATTFVADNWIWIEPIVWGLIGALTALGGVLLFVAARWLIMNVVMMANPYVLIIGAIIGLIAWLIKLWKTNDQFAAGLLRTWYAILNFFDQVPIFFAKVANGIINAFNHVKIQVLNIVQDLVNGVIQGINWMINQLNKIPGVSIQAISEVSFAAKAAARAEASRQLREAQIRGLEISASLKAMQREQRVQEMLAERAARREEISPVTQLSADQLKLTGALADGLKSLGDIGKIIKNGTGKIDKVGKVGSVGKIEDTVDISNEDIKLLRELAEMKSIQNFVTLTPQITFGDTHIRQDGRSIDEIIANITERLQEELAASTKGLFA